MSDSSKQPPKSGKKKRANTSSGKTSKSKSGKPGVRSGKKRRAVTAAGKEGKEESKSAAKSRAKTIPDAPPDVGPISEPPSDDAMGADGDTIRQPESAMLVDARRAAVRALVSDVRAEATVAILESAQASQTRAVQVVQSLGYAVAAETGEEALIGRVSGRSPPDILLVSLPEGRALVEAARSVEPLPPVVVASLAGPPATARKRFVELDADLFTVRPHSVDSLGPVLHASTVLRQQLDLLHAQRATEVRLRDELRSLGRSGEHTGFQHFEFFKRILVIEIKRARRFGYSLAVCLVAQDPWADGEPSPAGKVRIKRKFAGAIGRTIRDIDIPVDYADQRYLLFLPYTDLDGACRVGERVARAIVQHARVEERGREFVASASIGIAALVAGKPVSFARLMRDANAALRAAQLRGGARVVARR